MGCTTSVILFKGICTVLERNCAYICKQQGENNAIEYTVQSLSREDSGFTHSSLVNMVPSGSIIKQLLNEYEFFYILLLKSPLFCMVLLYYLYLFMQVMSYKVAYAYQDLHLQ